jgi:ABC-2 type transport system permease protein
MDYVAIKGHIESFASGLIDTRPIVYYCSATLLILMLTHQVLEYRRWKS